MISRVVPRRSFLLPGNLLWGLLLWGCVSARSPQLVAEHLAGLEQGYAMVREIGQSGWTEAEWSSRVQALEEVCPPLAAVGARLTTQERPGGQLGPVWDRLVSAQHHLQVACGELKVLGRGGPEWTSGPWFHQRQATASARLRQACEELQAAAAVLGKDPLRC